MKRDGKDGGLTAQEYWLVSSAHGGVVMKRSFQGLTAVLVIVGAIAAIGPVATTAAEATVLVPGDRALQMIFDGNREDRLAHRKPARNARNVLVKAGVFIGQSVAGWGITKALDAAWDNFEPLDFGDNPNLFGCAKAGVCN
jgi:hypothetical protein